MSRPTVAMIFADSVAPRERPEHGDVEEQAEQRREHEDHERGGGHDRPVEAGVELVVEERAR